MKRGTTFLVAGIVGAVLLISAAPALGQAATGQAPQGIVGGICRGVGSAANGVADLLGMKAADVATERRQGKSLADIAKEKGVSQDELINTILAPRKAALDQAVTDGRMTQAQADAMLARMQSSLTTGVQNTAPGGNGACDGTGGANGGCGGAGAGGAGGSGAGCGAGVTGGTTS